MVNVPLRNILTRILSYYTKRRVCQDANNTDGTIRPIE